MERSQTVGGEARRRRGVDGRALSAALLLLGIGVLGVAIGVYGKLEPCPGDCARTADPLTASDYVVWAIAAGGAVAIAALALIAWLAIRARTLVAVAAPPPAAAGEEPVRVCRRCSTQSRTSGDYCPHCGASYTRGRKPSRALLAGAAAVAVAIPVAGTLLYADSVDDDKQRRVELAEAFRTKQAQEEARREREEALELERQLEQEQVALRTELVGDVERSITKDMRERSQEELSIVEGPILGTQCDVAAGGDIEDLEQSSFELDCLSYNEREGDRLSGYSVASTVNFETGEYTWRLGR